MRAADADEPPSCVQVTISFVLITVDNGLTTTPLCGSFFDQQEQLATNGGMAVRSFIPRALRASVLTGGSYLVGNARDFVL